MGKGRDEVSAALDALRAALPDWSWSEHGNAPGVLHGYKGAHLSAMARRAVDGWWASAEYREVSTRPGRVQVAKRVCVVEAVQAALDALEVK